MATSIRSPPCANWHALTRRLCRPSNIGWTQRRRTRRTCGSATCDDLLRKPASAPENESRPSKDWHIKPVSFASVEYDFLFDKAPSSAVDRLQRRPSAGGTRATTICWLRKRDCAAFVAIAQGQLPQETLVCSLGVCSRPPVENRCSFRGAGRCSSISCRCW